jgi:hypothetical protein
MGALLEEPGSVKEGSGDGHLSPWGLRWETWERAHMPGGIVCGRRFWDGSLSI